MPVILIKLIAVNLPGALAGFLTGRITESKNGFLTNVISGAVGGLIGGFLFPLIGVGGGGFLSLIPAVIGACLAVWLFGLIKKH